MTPQSTFMVVAPVAAGREADLRALLASMNVLPGMADPDNDLVPFGRFERLHVARFLVLEAPTGDDILVYDIPPSPWPAALVFLGDCDGPAATFLRELAERAGPGLRRIFAFCRDFAADEDLLEWMRRHERRPSASYVNWIGRTVLQVHEEQALRAALIDHLQNGGAAPDGEAPSAAHQRLANFVDSEIEAGRLRLTPPAPTPWGWKIRNALDAVGVPVVLLALAPFLIVAAPVLAFQLRRREKSDPRFAPHPGHEHLHLKETLEDHDVSNQFTVFGDLKPGRFRRWTTMFLLWLLDYSARHVYRRGYLTRVRTIHFARWVFLDGRKRLFFASNYDGSLESYMDDFINKVSWGINLVFSNGIGYPSTDWLIKRGARDEQAYKRVLHRHQLPTDVWYKAYPGLTVVDLERNTRIRQGIARRSLSDTEAREWLRLL
jgi:hypothetical protein